MMSKESFLSGVPGSSDPVTELVQAKHLDGLCREFQELDGSLELGGEVWVDVKWVNVLGEELDGLPRLHLSLNECWQGCSPGLHASLRCPTSCSPSLVLLLLDDLTDWSFPLGRPPRRKRREWNPWCTGLLALLCLDLRDGVDCGGQGVDDPADDGLKEHVGQLLGRAGGAVMVVRESYYVASLANALGSAGKRTRCRRGNLVVDPYMHRSHRVVKTTRAVLKCSTTSGTSHFGSATGPMTTQCCCRDSECLTKSRNTLSRSSVRVGVNRITNKAAPAKREGRCVRDDVCHGEALPLSDDGERRRRWEEFSKIKNGGIGRLMLGVVGRLRGRTWTKSHVLGAVGALIPSTGCGVAEKPPRAVGENDVGHELREDSETERAIRTLVFLLEFGSKLGNRVAPLRGGGDDAGRGDTRDETRSG